MTAYVGEPTSGAPSGPAPVRYVPIGYADDETPPARTRTPRRRSRDIGAAIILLLAAAAAVYSWYGPWSRLVPAVTGQSVHASFAGFTGQTRWALAVQAVLVAGIVAGAAGLLLLVKTYLRRWLGALSLLCALTMVTAEAYFVIQTGFDLRSTWLGFWAYLGAGFLTLLGAAKAMGERRPVE